MPTRTAVVPGFVAHWQVMHLLDIRTLLFADALVGFSLACVVWVSRRGPDGAVLPAARLWALSELVCALARTLYVTREEMAPALAIVLPNSLLLTGYLLRYLALATLFGPAAQPGRSAGLAVSLGAGVWVAFSIAALAELPFGVRALLFTALGLLILGLMLRLLWPHLRLSPGARVIAVAVGATAALGVVRLLTGALQGASHIFEAFAGQFMLVVGSIVLNVAAAAGFLLCLHEGIRRELQRLSVTDTLTGTANRRGLLDSLQQQVDRVRRSARPLSVVMFDLDHFKRVNDELGHLAGDRALRDFAELVRAGLRSSDLLGRYGGEEFVLVLQDTSLADAHRIAERARAAVAQAHRQGQLPVTVSAGVACSSEAGIGADVQGLLAAADRRLYLAKRSRNQVAAQDSDTVELAPAGC